MFVVKEILKNKLHLSAKHFAIGGVFALALAGAITLGLNARQHGSALTTVRECEHNSIDYKNYNGGCGAYSPSEWIADQRNNDPADLQIIARNFSSDFHLDVSEYDSFASKAVDGIAYKNGEIRLMDGTLVATDGWSIGRDKKSYASSYSIPGDATSYWKSRAQDVFRGNEIPVMIYFDNQGAAQMIVMKPCGNLMGGTKITSSASCKALNADQSTTNPNKYSFTTNGVFAGNAKFQKVVYHFSDTNEDVTKDSLTAGVDHVFAKNADVTVTIYATVPGGSVITSQCVKHITYVPPMAVCTALVPTVLDTKNQQFRFTIKVATDKYTSLKDADYTLDKTTTSTNVTTKDANGNIYKDYTLTDGKDHTVSVVVRFTTLEGDKTDVNCSAKVTSEKTPVCTVPGHEGEAPDSPTCGYCKPGIPIGDASCKDTPAVLGASTTAVLANTGPGDVFGLFAGTSILGTLGHRLYTKRRNRRG
ncbi:MAG TPA: hypothetical protein VMR45_03660 [Patescibacteria group bacterium]|nr:hypothetical protein [Patescibacteria group bacterium]